MIPPLVLGLVIGLGSWLFYVGLRPRPRPLGLVLNELELPYEPVRASGYETAHRRLLGAAAGSVTPQLARDLAVLQRTTADHARSKLSNSLLLAVFAAAAWLMFTITSGIVLPPALLGVGVVGFGAVGWLITDRITHQRAQRARALFRSSLVTYLQLVAILLAGGAGTNEALHRVTRFGHGDGRSRGGFAEIEDALTEARVRGVSPWTVFASVAAQKGLSELDELAAAVELAGMSGARVRNSLLTKATSMRQAELAQVQSDAAAASESMGVPVGIMLIGFVVAIGFPAFLAILRI